MRWCEGEAYIDNLNNLTGRDLTRFKHWRREDGDLNKVSLHTQLSTLKVFLKWAEQIEAVKLGMFEYVQPPKIRGDDDVREIFIEPEFMFDILAWYDRFDYASLEHTLINLLWVTGMRIGAARAIDIEDYKPQLGRIELNHRPETETPLKKKKNGERFVAINDAFGELLDDYIQHSRPDVQDDSGRNPLFTTSHGRAHKNTLRDTVYKATRPCISTGGCPGDREIEKCDSYKNKTDAYKCPYNFSPHAIRKGTITYSLKNDVPAEKISARMNVSAGALEKHYDMQTREESMKSRRDYFDDLY